MRDPYTVLGVARTAKADDIKAAYRKLAKKYHPDQNPDDPKAKERFAEIGQAYEILKDSETRGRYDRGEIDEAGKDKFTGFAGAGAGGDPFGAFRQGGRGGFEYRSGNFGGGAPEDIISELFGSAFGGPGGGQFRSGPRKGPDMEVGLSITLREAAAGDKVNVLFPDGRKLSVKLPAYVEDGQVIRLSGQGAPGPGGMRGDALVKIAIRSEPGFRLEGRDVIADVPIPLADAVLGAKLPFETLDGKVAITVPAWSNSGTTLRLKGKGLPLKTGGRGDMKVVLQVTLPEGDRELETLMRKRRP